MVRRTSDPSERAPATTPVIDLVSCDSTNAYALRIASGRGGADCWITAERQEAGRGRSGRSWISPPGNLYATRLLHLATPARLLPQLSLLAGVALHDAICAAVPDLAAESLRLKWPNDVLLHGAKLAGVLIESTTSGSTPIAVVGIGVNISAAPPGLTQRVTALSDHGHNCDRLALLTELDHAFERWLPTWSGGDGFPAIRGAWLARAIPRASPIRAHTGTAIVDGLFDGIDADGALSIVATDGSVVRVTFGDVDIVADVVAPIAERAAQQD